MSALTKVFVVLHVIVSLLLVAGMVVFVNKVEDFGKSAQAAKDDLKLANSARDAERTRNQQLLAEKENAANEAISRANVLTAANAALQTQLAARDQELAKSRADKAVVDAQLTTATSALDVAQQANLKREEVANGLRGRIEDLEKKYTDSQVSLSDFNNRLDASNQELRYSKEQVAALQTELRVARESLARGSGAPAPGTPGAPGSAPGAPRTAVPAAPPAVAIRGVVNSKFQVGPVEYATVGLGAADGVTKGTKFNVVDPSGSRFLGYLIVDSVSPNESSGHLSGPDVASIQKGSRVLTGWQ